MIDLARTLSKLTTSVWLLAATAPSKTTSRIKISKGASRCRGRCHSRGVEACTTRGKGQEAICMAGTTMTSDLTRE